MKRNYYLVFFVFIVCAPFVLHAQEPAVASWQVARYNITATINSADPAARSLTAKAVIEATNIGQGTGRTFTVRINPKAEISAVSVGGAAAQFVKREDARSRLQQAQITLPSAVAPGESVSVAVEYKLPVADNSALAAISNEGSQFLPLSSWYPTPNTQFAARGVDTAPMRLTVNGLATGETVVSSGQSSAGAATFEQTLFSQPFFLTGKWDVVEGAGEAKGVSAWLAPGASADERKRAESLIAIAAAARSFYAGVLGASAAEAPVRLVASRRGAGFDAGGTILLDSSVFRRAKADAATVQSVAEGVARLWVGGAARVEGEVAGAGAGVVREGLSRYLATLFVEKRFGREHADAALKRAAFDYAPAARNDAPLSQSTPLLETHSATVSNKGALVWRLVAGAVGRDNFLNILRREIEANRGRGRITLGSLRAALGGNSSGESLKQLVNFLFDQPTDTDFIVGLPKTAAGDEQEVELANLGSLDADVSVAALTDAGQRLSATAKVPAKGRAQARFKTRAKIVRVEVDPERLYPQTDFARDSAPWGSTGEELLATVAGQFASQQYERAASTARALMQAAPHVQEARTWLARALLEQNKLDEAEKEFRAALDHPLPSAATLAWSNIGLGEIVLRRRQTAEAVKYFGEAASAEGDYDSALAARLARIRAESAAPPPTDEAARAFVAQLDQAILSGRKVTIESLIVPGELASFARGIVSSQPEIWKTRVIRTETLGANRVAVDVFVNTNAGAKEQAGPVTLILTRTPAGLRLSDIQFLKEVR